MVTIEGLVEVQVQGVSGRVLDLGVQEIVRTIAY